ncbi:MAG: phosphatidate cytidylyltransferase [Promethearchaeota archaeon]
MIYDVARVFIWVKTFFFVLVFALAMKRQARNVFTVASSASSIVLVIFNAWFLVFSGLVEEDYTGLLFCWGSLWMFILFLRSGIRHYKIKNGRERVIVDLKVTGLKDDLESKHELLRKIFHLTGFLLVVAYFLIVPPVLDFLHTFNVPGDSDAFTMFLLLCGVDLVVILDTQRILFGEAYGFRRASMLLREKEIGSPCAQTFLLASATASWMVAMYFRSFVGDDAMRAPLVAVMVATLADGMAAVIGKSFGKHKVNLSHGQVKSVEGFMAGFITSFLVALPFLFSMKYGCFISLVVAFIFLVIDLLSSPVADNILNPIMITVGIDLLLLVR